MNPRRGFTLIEVLVVIAVIGILAGLLLPTLNSAKSRAKRAYCVNNLRQLDIALRLYADDHDNALPFAAFIASQTNYWWDLRSVLAGYVSSPGPSTASDGLFACPADTFFYDKEPANTLISASAHSLQRFNYSSYAFNSGNVLFEKDRWPGIAGRKMNLIKEPTRTVLVTEVPAVFPFSWHQPRRLPPGSIDGVNNSRNVIGFVDGHVDYVKMFWDEINLATGHQEAWQYDPPAGYDYKWSGD